MDGQTDWDIQIDNTVTHWDIDRWHWLTGSVK